MATYFFKYNVGDLVRYGDLDGVVTGIDTRERYGIEVEFIDARGNPNVTYFDNSGKYRNQDTGRTLTSRDEGHNQ